MIICQLKIQHIGDETAQTHTQHTHTVINDIQQILSYVNIIYSLKHMDLNSKPVVSRLNNTVTEIPISVTFYHVQYLKGMCNRSVVT